MDTIQTNTAHSRYQDELAKRKDNLLSKAFQYAALKRLADSIREKSENRIDSIKSVIKIEFDIPTLRPVKEGARIGLLIWLLLINISIYQIILARSSIFKSLQSLYRFVIREQQMPIRDIQKLDLALPFWSYPIRATRESNPVFRKAIYTLEKKSYSKTLVAATLAVLFLLISFNVFRINWTLNDIVIKAGQRINSIHP